MSTTMSRFLRPGLVGLLVLVGSGCDTIPVNAPEALHAEATATHLVLTNQTDVPLSFLAGDPEILALIFIAPDRFAAIPSRRTVRLPLTEVIGYRPETRVISITW